MALGGRVPEQLVMSNPAVEARVVDAGELGGLRDRVGLCVHAVPLRRDLSYI